MKIFGPLLLTQFILLATDGAGGSPSVSKYDELTVVELQKEIIDREIPESTSGLKKAELVALLVKHDELRAAGKFIVPSFKRFQEAYPNATEEGYADRFFGFKEGDVASDAEIEANRKQAAEQATRAVQTPVVTKSSAQITNKVGASEKVVKMLAESLPASDTYEIKAVGKSQVVLHGAKRGAFKVNLT